MEQPLLRPFSKDQHVIITSKAHPHTGEHGVLTGQVIKETGQLYMEVLDCSHGKTEVVAMPEQISLDIAKGQGVVIQEDKPKPTGRPSGYTEEIALKICEGLAIGQSLRTVLIPEDMPSMSMVFRWLADERYLTFREQYTRAKEEAADAMAEDILDIADDGTNDWIEREREDGSTFEVINSEVIQRSRLRVETRKWLMAKTKPKKYGDKLDLTSAGEKLQRGASIEEIDAILARAEKEAAERAAKTNA